MAAPSISLDDLKKFKPCYDRLRVIAPAFNGGRLTARQAVKAGVTLDDLAWVATAYARRDKDIDRRLRMWAADCAAHVLHIYEQCTDASMAPRVAIGATRAFARGDIDNAAWDAARAAARAAASDAAWAAASDAAWAAARAAAWAAASDAAWAAEKAWQLDRLVVWLSSRTPKPLPLPELPAHMTEAA